MLPNIKFRIRYTIYNIQPEAGQKIFLNGASVSFILTLRTISMLYVVEGVQCML